ncbi:bifunctional folylpolyglutamate synthase/dihydrofolate synthase [Acholeplasma equirhinis]|uniref:bifunctional folylpolyglutamate synthase/dihydrofolate synthase n=1 Tax=Acholeplasma equirhinis TaxID=555393 RepID=UPI00197A92E5|nr:folylpolyglutamate synthase/dihydrofolate synthase family protein [Acholeplasma equirhinis]MBN3490288.1 bifunctional folylpolyglutamate synthase/dihydrofolate synthase [Acholeplasma equirhinis]
MFNTLNDAKNWVETQVKFRPKVSLDHIKRALAMLSLDFSGINKIHVTGTNGKGSVCMYTTTVLVEAGLKVGTFTSPYLISFNERIKLNNQNITDEAFLKLLNEIYELNENYKRESGETLSFFELLTLAALKYFAEEKVDVMVIEVGIGGLLDSTNILDYDVSVITNVGLEHTKQLGDTIEKITYNKLGIVKKNHHLITTIDPKQHAQVIAHCQNVGATYQLITDEMIKTISDYPYIIEYDNKQYELSLLGDYQKYNASLAIEVVRYLYPEIDDTLISRGLSKTIYPGRLETVLDGVIIDGAHNMHAINALIISLHSVFKMYNIHVLFSALSDKEPLTMLDALKPHVSTITTTAFPDTRYVTLEKLPYNFEIDPLKALKNLIKNKRENDLVIITGSLHFIGYMKKEIIPYL